MVGVEVADPDRVQILEADVALERGLLFFVGEDFVVRVVEDQGLVTLQILVGEDCGVIRDVHHEAIVRAQLLNSRDAGRDVVVDIEALADLVPAETSLERFFINTVAP